MRISALFLSILVLFVASINAEDNKFKQAVRDQRSSDVKRKNELIEKMHSQLAVFNKRLKNAGVTADLISPVDEKTIENMDETKDYHKPEVIKKLSAFTKVKTDIFDSGDTLKRVSGVDRGEEIELLEKTADVYEYKGKKGKWFLIRKENGDEGWIHSAFLTKVKPAGDTRAPEKTAESGELSFDTPVPGRRTSNFGSRVDPVTKKSNSFHSGIDIAAPSGTPVKSAENGVIKSSTYNKNGYGNLIIVDHGKDFVTYYGHLSKMNVTTGAKVKKGELIGAVGSTGKSTGPHLHFEVRKGSEAMNPDAFMR